MCSILHPTRKPSNPTALFSKLFFLMTIKVSSPWGAFLGLAWSGTENVWEDGSAWDYQNFGQGHVSAHLISKILSLFSITRIFSQIASSPRAASSLVSTQTAVGLALLPKSASTQETNPPTASVNDQSKF